MKYPRLEVAILLAIFILIMTIGTSPASADDPHHETTINITETGKTTMHGTALSLAAAAHSFDWSTKDLQGSVGLGGYSGENALSFGIGKRYGRTLLNGSLGISEGETGYSAAVNWHF